jgi:hypothetical protein
MYKGLQSKARGKTRVNCETGRDGDKEGASSKSKRLKGIGNGLRLEKNLNDVHDICKTTIKECNHNLVKKRRVERNLW